MFVKNLILQIILFNLFNFYNVRGNGIDNVENYSSPFPLVCVANGCIEGIAQTGFIIDAYEAFLGIPYAEKPIGSLRFSNPVPAKPWNSVYNAKREQPFCIQKNFLLPKPIIMGEEDCLYLNIYRPMNTSKRNNSSLPVMVYIHEGGFFAGTISPQMRGPQYFMDTSAVILVLMSYRLGVFGFLSTGDAASPGNFGLKDQSLALKWIKENIEDFGGDPNSITIFGASAGGSAVHMHMMSPLSNGLFNRAITMSGFANCPFNEPTRKPYALAKRQAEALGIENIENLSTYELVNKLRKINATQLVDSIDSLKYWSIDPLVLYRTVIEKDAPGAFITEHPATTWRKGNFSQVPWMTSVVPNEGTVRAAIMLSNRDLLEDFNFRMESLLHKLMELTPKTQANIPEINKKLRDFYLNGSKNISELNSQGLVNMITDRAFLHPYYKSVENYIQYADLIKNPVFLYRFAYKGQVSYSSLFSGTSDDYGVSHLDDLIYLFKSPIAFSEFDKNSTEVQLIRQLVDTFVSFAKYGQPIIWHETKPCNKYHEGAICDYQEFRNLGNDANNKEFEIVTSNEFDLTMIKFWDDILKL